MFNNKKHTLFAKEERQKRTSGNKFVDEAMKDSAKTRSGNFARKYSTTGNDFVDQFGKASSYLVPRNFDEISTDMSVLWSNDPETTVKFTIYLRMITRTTQKMDGNHTESVQRGAGLKHESIMRMIWLHLFHKEAFWNNIDLFIASGSWKDVFQMLSYDLQYNGWEQRQLDWEKFFQLIAAGLENPNHCELIKKYLPQIKARSKCTTLESQADTLIGKWLTAKFYPRMGKQAAYKRYRKMKSSGTAHEWQKLISQRRFLEIDFETVHGRALSQLVSSKFLENQGLVEKYEKWIESKPIAKFTGFPHELFSKYLRPTGWGASDMKELRTHEIHTLNKQFYGLVETAKKGINQDTTMIVARDTSGSMAATAEGTKMSCGDIAKSLAMFMSYMLPDGAFSKSWIEFSNTATLKQWKGSNPYEHWKNDDTHYALNTSFLSVIDLFVSMKRKGVNEDEFPSGIVCISDGEFDPDRELDQTNVDAAFRKLKDAGFTKGFVNNFQIAIWNLTSRFYGRNTGKKFETYGNKDNIFYLSGYDPSILAFLTGLKEPGRKQPKNAEELFEEAMNQELLNEVEV